jgi:hypothetical protein
MKIFLLAIGAGLLLASANGAQAYHRFWTNCNYASPTFMTTMTRDAGQDYANAARYEGYQWGGGCWNYDDVDSYPSDAPGDPSTHGEGGDCSGLTFKTWRESTDEWRDGRYYWRALRNVHGPYTAGDFKNGIGAPNHVVAKATAGVMDAFASSSHIGMVFARSLYGGDQIVEAKCEACGTNIFYRTYRSDPSYGGVAGGAGPADHRGPGARPHACSLRQRREPEPSAPVALRRASPGAHSRPRQRHCDRPRARRGNAWPAVHELQSGRTR